MFKAYEDRFGLDIDTFVNEVDNKPIVDFIGETSKNNEVTKVPGNTLLLRHDGI
ncbi:MAG: hypothetical protein UU16_C0046G0005 [Candidatus Woesebacteria bacterium GW2011_GWA2_40_7]|uniref:Uncharacterized protein n=1 Tax=Candidatus Woesebacteria bacterium GW2011_GWA2_40_7 TaxID=1618562 RepID=A0A0G0TBB4_9BACT|nr:MAG: hypothetical protein UU16_C0046G0005 [Candidatus Woesebacteria bacterium GW2011_GWA2_40_7]